MSASRAVIALGSNLGDSEGIIRAAIEAIDGLDGVSVLRASGLVESHALKPQGVDDTAPNYLNAVLVAEVTCTPHQLLDALNDIEARHGRVREVVWGDRTLDLDLIVFGDVELQTPRLTLPHPRAWQRAFVVVPWLQVEPDARLAGHGRIAELAAATDGTVWEHHAAPLISHGAAS